MNRVAPKLFTATDFLFVILMICLSAVLFHNFFSINEHADIVEIFIDNNLSYRLPLNIDKVFPLETAIGIDTIEIKDGSVFIRESPCTRQICVKRGHISKPSSSIVCVPGHLFITVKKSVAKENEKIDAISQ